MNIHLDELLSSKKVLFLQGPMGDFFKKLSEWLISHEIECFKVNFNAGDLFYYTGPNVSNYRGRLNNFENWLIEYIKTNKIDSMVCFGDCRYYHQIAKKVSSDLKIKFFVFEEGYVRPYYITFEKNGVNANSSFKKCFEDSHNYSEIFMKPDQPAEVNASYSLLVRTAITYYSVLILFFWLYPFYNHHRSIFPALELVYWLNAFIKRLKNYLVEPKIFQNIIENQSHRYFIVALQVHNDSQIRVHSDYADVANFIEEVMRSFAQHADQAHCLVLKHHPMDRGYRDYRKLIRSLAHELNIADRVSYVCDVHLPTLMKNSLGMVTVNSTTGIQSLHHGKPVMAMGRAIYNMDKLTFQGELDQFWSNPGRVNRLHYRRFRYAIVRYSQLNGSFYGINQWMQDDKVVGAEESTIKVN